MKKIKLLTSLAGLSALSMGLVPTIASCSCSSTGLQVEMVSKKKDREFNQKTNGCTYTFKLNNISTTTNLKVKVVNLLVDGAETKSVAGLLKTTYDSAGNIQILINTNILINQWPNAKTIAFDLLFTDKTTGQASTLTGFNLTYNALLTAPNFYTVDWSVVIEKVKEYYEGTLSIEDFAKSFGDEDGIAFTSIDQYIGLQKTVTINNLAHKVRIIGINHDTLVTKAKASDTALFTFELVTLLSDSNGGISSQWDSTNNFNYTNSILRWNLNGNGSGTKPAGVWTNSALSLLPSELKNNIQTVQKQVAISTDSGGTYTVSKYNDKLFPLTYTEMGQAGDEKAKVEGSAYQYWIDHAEQTDYIKRDINNNIGYFPLTTPEIDKTDCVWHISSYGYIVPWIEVDMEWSISFAFCI